MLNLAEYRTRPDWLPDWLPWAALIGPGIVLNKDGSLQRTCLYRGPDLASATSEELVTFTARVNNAFKRFGSGWAIFFEAQNRPSTDYPVSHFASPVAWLVDEERRAGFEAEGEHFETDTYLTLTWLPPADKAGRMESIFVEDPNDAACLFWRDHLEGFVSETDRAMGLVQSLMQSTRWLSDDETLTYLHSTISTKRHSVRTPETPFYLDAALADSALTGGLAPYLGGEALRTLSIQGFPPMTEPGLLSDLSALGFSYRWCTRFLPMDKTEAEKTLTRYRRQWFATRKSAFAMLKETLLNEESALLNPDADTKAACADAALASLGDDLVSYGYLTTSLTVCHPDPAIADERLAAAERVINGRGFVTIKETLNAVDAWLGSLPGQAYANVRQPIVHTLNLAHMAPLASVWAGPDHNAHLDGPPLLMATTTGTTPYRLVTHQGDVGHTMIVGPTGAGKSVLLSLLALQFQRYDGAQVFIFDKGRSSRGAVLGLNGRAYDLSLEGDLAFQPLARLNEDAERAFTSQWILGRIEQEGVPISPETKDAIWSAIASLADTPVPQRTLTGLSALIQSAELRQALQPYTLNGPYGALLDADTDSLTSDHVACFEMEELMQDPKLAAPVLAYLFHRLEDRFDGAPTLLILDEAWLFLDHPMFAGRLREWLKTLRKKNVSVVFATQSLSDVSGSSIAPTLIESCPTRIFLANGRAEEPGQAEIYQNFGLNARQTAIIARAAPKKDYYLQCPDGNRLFDLELGPIALAFCAAGSKADLAAIDRVLSQHGEDAFASYWLRHRNLDWAADLLDDQIRGGLPCAAE